MSFPAGPVAQYQNRLGLGVIDRPIYYVMNPVQKTASGTIHIFGAATATLRGKAVILPWWLVTFVAVLLAYAGSAMFQKRRGGQA